MPWFHNLALHPALPAHCEPTNDFLLRFSSAFHTCVPTPLAFTSNTLGTLSIVAWLFAQLPQIYKNYNLGSTSGLSIFFLVEWCLGDISNLLGALFTHQATWQVAIGAYYVFVDLCLVGQWIWYERLKHGHIMRKVWPRNCGDRPEGGMQEMTIDGASIQGQMSNGDGQMEADAGNAKPSRPRIIFRQPTFERERKSREELASSSLSRTPGGTGIYRAGASSPLPSPSPRTMLLVACLIAITHASPLGRPTLQTTPTKATALETAGTILSWMSTFLYLGSRLPQLFKNWQRKSTAGLSPLLFMAAFCGNLFYSSALLTNPCAWFDFGPYGGGGWVGAAGSDRARWVGAALPFFLGAAGVLGLDWSVGVQFFLYGDSAAKVLVLEEDQKWHWRRVSGWLRGWVPSVSEGRATGEREALVARGEDESYGTA
ncbi:hypothetical protein B0A50_03681 [Salinomyces thailandicus]|uniref:PQ loop repeat protein n=1 Tax=Salinomyces thailandicus TaxID=706561 RepID=A0A4U0U2G0_9PEZI|nr:hypothetical protein B0A50_03681 [Salinomyces thailandica]